MDIDLDQAIRKLARDVDLDSFSLGYCLKRFHVEGISFLTKTLPKLAKSVLRSIEIGHFDRPTDFAWKGRSLRYFRSFLSRIFCERTGVLLGEPDPVALWQIRQFCEYMYKLALPFSDSQERTNLNNWKIAEAEVSTGQYDSAFVKRLSAFIQTHYPVFCNTKLDDVLKHYRPRDTSGSFVGKRTEQPYYVERLMPSERIGLCRRQDAAYSGVFKPYPSSPLYTYYAKRHKFVTEPSYSEVLFVPKDSRGPRVISKEPRLALKLQMSYFDFAVDALERDTDKRINFRDQSKNNELARSSSLDRRYATLDLKEASDRVSFSLVRSLFANIPVPRWFLLRARTPTAQLPTGERVQLRKLSGMGSGLTFPTMALLIHASVSALVARRTGLSAREAMSQVYVYGDDVVVPREWYSIACEALSRVGLLVNKDKSFVLGNFRESCGGDYFHGNDVGIVRLKLTFSNTYASKRMLHIKGDNGLLKLERHCRELVKSGLHLVADFYYKHLEKAFGPLPAVSGVSPVLGRYQLLTPSLPEPDPLTGNYPRIKYRVALPVTVEGPVCPYKHLGKFLGIKVDTDDSMLYMDRSEGSEFGLVAAPRQIKIVCAEESALVAVG